MRTQKTTLIKDKDITRNWHEIDAAGVTLGRLSTQVARFLSGKHKTNYAPHQDLGDFVVIKNAEKVKVSVAAKKMQQKIYHSYSGYPGGIRSETLADKFAKDPTSVVRAAVRGMLDDNRLRKPRLRRLKIVTGDKHNFPVK